VLFAVALASLPPHNDKRLWERVLVGGSVLAGTIFLITGIVNFALVDGATNDASEEALQALSLLLGNNWVGFNAGLGVMMIGAAGMLLARPRAHAGLGWTALALAIALFIPFIDFIALLLTVIWIIVASACSSVRRSVTWPSPCRTPNRSAPPNYPIEKWPVSREKWAEPDTSQTTRHSRRMCSASRKSECAHGFLGDVPDAPRLRVVPPGSSRRPAPARS
jgi:hypothetical protein